MMRRYLNLFLMLLTLSLLPIAHSEMPISINSSLNSFEHDLDNIHLKLERLSAQWQLSPADGTLQVHMLKAQRLIIELKETDKPAESSGGLPEKITLPLPISITQAEIQEVLIISKGEQKILHQVRFNLAANSQRITLNLSEAHTPWGDVHANVQLATAKPFPLQGFVQIAKLETNNDAALAYDFKTTLNGSLEQLNFNSDHVLTQHQGQLRLQPIDTSPVTDNRAGRITLDGFISLAQDNPLQLNLRISELRTEHLGSDAQGQLNLEANISGKLQPQPDLQMQMRTTNSHWRNHPLDLQASANWVNQQLQTLTLQAKLGDNQLQANGSLGAENSILNWQASLPQPNTFNPELTGDVAANGAFKGRFDNLISTFKLEAKNLQRGTQFKLASMQADAEIHHTASGKLSAHIKANTMEIGERPAVNVQTDLTGTVSEHQLNMTAQNPQQQWMAVFNGGIKTQPQEMFWQGLIQQLSYQGETTITLKAPAPLKVSAQHTRLENAVLQFASGLVDIALVDIQNGHLNTRGSISQLRLTDLPEDIFVMPNSLQGSPTFSGGWHITAQEQINGSINLARDGGDFMINKFNADPIPLGLSKSSFSVNIVNGKIDANLDVAGDQLGIIQAEINTVISKNANGFVLLGSSPFKLDANATLSSLAWVPFPNSLPDAELDGKITLSANAEGTIATPNFHGKFNGQDLMLNLASQGVALKQGNFDAVFEQDKLQINHFVWNGETGSISTSGFAMLNQTQPKLSLDWKADQFTLLSRTDRLLILNGHGKTILQDDILRVSGEFVVKKGLIEIAGENAPSLSDDVVVIGRSQVQKQAAVQVLLDGLNINLGDDFVLRGHGLDALLIGEVTLNGLTQYQPHTVGSVQVKRGTFMAYGQLLNIERGILNFNGPTENPGLNIRAMRNTKPVSAGVEITGTALAPVTKLVSTPNVSDTEKLSWLVLGHGLDQAGKSQYAMLSLAASALFANNESVPLQTKIARAAGLDDLSFAGNDAETAAVSFGKRLTSDLYLSYEKSISGLLDVARLTYFITPVWQIRGASGAESAVDVLYTFSFK